MGAVLETDTLGWAKPSLARRGLALWSTPTTRQGILSVADQASRAPQTFLQASPSPGPARRKQLGLYMLGFSLILFLTDLQNSVIATPYMVYAPRLKMMRTRRIHGQHLGPSVRALLRHRACSRRWRYCAQARDAGPKAWKLCCGLYLQSSR